MQLRQCQPTCGQAEKPQGRYNAVIKRGLAGGGKAKIECALCEVRDFNAAPAASNQRLAAAAGTTTGEALNSEPNFGFKFMLCAVVGWMPLSSAH